MNGERPQNQTLAGRYALRKILGRGGMGEVWLAHDLRLGRDVAVKLIHGEFAVDPVAAKRLEREARAAAQVDDEHVLAVHDVGQDDGRPFIVMALAKGRSLRDVLDEAGPLTPQIAANWAGQVCLGLAAAHAKNIVHRDIKPGNVMVDDQGRVVVLDFGIAHFEPAHDLTRLTATAAAVGSVPWMAPEQAAGAPIDHRADLYALGCLVYQMLTGRPPFGDRDVVPILVAHATKPPLRPSAVRGGIPPELDDLVMALLAKDPQARPGAALEVATRLADLAASGTDQQPGPSAAAAAPVSTAGSDPATALLPTTPETPAGEPVGDRGRRPNRRTVLFGLGVVVVGGGTTTTVALLPGSTKGSRSGTGGSVGGEATANPTAASAARLGTQLWQRPADPTQTSILGTWNGVAVMKGNGQYTGIDTATGRQKWSRKPSSDQSPSEDVQAADGTLYVSSQDSSIQRISLSDGNATWTYTFKEPNPPAGDNWVADGYTPHVDLSADGRTLYAASAKFVVALNTADGSEAWTTALDDVDGLQPIISSVIATDHALLLQEQSGSSNANPIHGLDLATRTVVWNGTSTGIVAKAADRLFVSGYQGQPTASISMVRTTDGKVLWTSDATTSVLGAFRDPGVFFTSARKGTQSDELSGLDALSLVDGHTLWTRPDLSDVSPIAIGAAHASRRPVLALGKASDRWTTSALDLDTGKTLWHIDGAYPYASPDPNTTRHDSESPAPPSPWLPAVVWDQPATSTQTDSTAGPSASTASDTSRSSTADLTGIDPMTGSAAWRVPHTFDDAVFIYLAEDAGTGRILVMTMKRSDQSSGSMVPGQIFCLAPPH